MEKALQNSGYCRSSPEIYRILRTTIAIFDSAITLLGEPSGWGAALPDPAVIECMKRILRWLGIGEGAMDIAP